MLHTPLCQDLGITYPIFSVGMGGGMAGPRLTAAVSNAGGGGVLGMGGLPAPFIQEQIQQVRTLTERPFGVNIILPLLQEGQIETCFAEAVPLLVLFWGDPEPYVKEAHRVGTKVFLQAGSVEEALTAVNAGVDGIIAQGVEAGGHVKSTTSLSTIVPAMVEAVGPVPVIAAGGIATGRGVVAALTLGAQAVSMGTRFVASEEVQVVQAYKQRIVDSTAEDTVYTTLFDVGWPDAAHRVLRNTAMDEWEAAGCPASGQRPGEGRAIGTMPMAGTSVELPKYGIFPPMPGFAGDLEQTALYAGESCRLIHDVKPASHIVRDIMAEAEEIVQGLRA
ncbi:MAG: nitronate monooxygenase [Desulfurellaceae bacterium]|nr:nitronate monooxygenase [Desulfurellaceae bacterium]